MYYSLIRNFFLLIIILFNFIIANVSASSPEAWNKHEKEVLNKCIATSTLKNVEPAGKIVTFDDTIGFDTLLLRGNYAQKHMKNAPGLELCLFDRKKEIAYVTEADNIIVKSKP